MATAGNRNNDSLLQYELDTHCIQAVFRGKPACDKIREYFSQMLTLMVKHQTNKLLIDLSEMDAFSHENQQWICHEWFPQARKAGCLAIALVMPLEIISFLVSNQLSQFGRNTGMDVRGFRHPAEGSCWLARLSDNSDGVKDDQV